MPVTSDQFNTVSDDLLEATVSPANTRQISGYRISVEPDDVHLPYTPALKIVRDRESTYVDVGGARLPKRRLEDWISYAASCPKDTRILYCSNARLSDASESWLRQRKVGLVRFRDGEIIEQMAPHDLAMQLGLPKLTSLKSPLRKKLSKSYEKHANGDWRGAFEEACKAFELECRRYLRSAKVQHRANVVVSGGRKLVSLKTIDITKKPMGALATTFENIVPQTQLDNRIGKALRSVNPDRISVAHKKTEGEVRLRRNVGRNMWAIIRCMREM